MRRKEERSKQGQTTNKAKTQHTCTCICLYFIYNYMTICCRTCMLIQLPHYVCVHVHVYTCIHVHVYCTGLVGCVHMFTQWLANQLPQKQYGYVLKTCTCTCTFCMYTRAVMVAQLVERTGNLVPRGAIYTYT